MSISIFKRCGIERVCMTSYLSETKVLFLSSIFTYFHSSIRFRKADDAHNFTLFFDVVLGFDGIPRRVVQHQLEVVLLI